MSKQLRGIDPTGLRLLLVDAKGHVVGRLASRLATVLQGKDKPVFANNRDDGDVVVVINARHVDFTGRKWDNKVYRWHTGYPGGLKERTASNQHDRDPTKVLYNAVYGMLPKNLLRKAQARKLRIFPEDSHPFEDHPALQVWDGLRERNIRIKGDLFELPEGYEPANPEAWWQNSGRLLEQRRRKQEEAAELAVRLEAVRKWKEANGERF